MCTTRVFFVAILSCVLRLAVALPTVCAAEAGWPEGYVIAENSQSPDGRFGVLIPGREVGSDADNPDSLANKVVNLKTHQRLCTIRNSHYAEGQNHYGLIVKWAPDSGWCIVTYDARYGFGSITLVEIAGNKCLQTDLGKEIQGAMDAVITRVSHNVQTSGYGMAYFRPGPKRTILVRGTSYTNPKAFEDQPTNYARFEGTFDLTTHKWTHSSAANLDDADSLTAALAEAIEPTEGTDEEKLQWLDNRLNELYKGLQAVFPAKRFAALKKEQRDWLKQFEAQKSVAEKIKLMRARVAQLQDMLW